MLVSDVETSYVCPQDIWKECRALIMSSNDVYYRWKIMASILFMLCFCEDAPVDGSVGKNENHNLQYKTTLPKEWGLWKNA